MPNRLFFLYKSHFQKTGGIYIKNKSKYKNNNFRYEKN